MSIMLKSIFSLAITAPPWHLYLCIPSLQESPSFRAQTMFSQLSQKVSQFKLMIGRHRQADHSAYLTRNQLSCKTQPSSTCKTHLNFFVKFYVIYAENFQKYFLCPSQNLTLQIVGLFLCPSRVTLMHSLRLLTWWVCNTPFITPNFVIKLTYNVRVSTLMLWCQTLLYDVMFIFINKKCYSWRKMTANKLWCLGERENLT